MDNEKIINKVKNKIAISNFELEEKIVMNKRKKILSITSVIVICLVCSFATVNAITGNAVVNNIQKTTNKIFKKENISANYIESNIVADENKENYKVDSKQEIADVEKNNSKVVSKQEMPVKFTHNGVDFKAESGDDIVVVADGEVVEAGYNGLMGNCVLVKHNNSDFTYTKYAHLSKINVKVGEIVKKDTKIGEAGNTGNATGVCLHFEVLDKDMNSINPNNFDFFN